MRLTCALPTSRPALPGDAHGTLSLPPRRWARFPVESTRRSLVDSPQASHRRPQHLTRCIGVCPPGAMANHPGSCPAAAARCRPVRHPLTRTRCPKCVGGLVADVAFCLWRYCIPQCAAVRKWEVGTSCFEAVASRAPRRPVCQLPYPRNSRCIAFSASVQSLNDALRWHSTAITLIVMVRACPEAM